LTLEPLNVTEPAIKEKDLVETRKGAKFRGIVLAIYPNLRGEMRCSVEATDPHFDGTIHVYPLAQMRIVWE